MEPRAELKRPHCLQGSRITTILLVQSYALDEVRNLEPTIATQSIPPQLQSISWKYILH